MIRKNYHIELVEAICKKIDANEFVKEDENIDEYKKYLKLQGKEKRYSWNEIIDVAKRIIQIYEIQKIYLEIKGKPPSITKNDKIKEIKNKSREISRYGLLRLLKKINEMFDFQLNLIEHLDDSDYVYSLFKVWSNDNAVKKYFVLSVKDEKWHEFCRLTKDFEVFSHIRDSILRCITNNPMLTRKVFEFKYQKVPTRLPDRKARIKQLDSYFKKFQSIHQRIINEISYENRYVQKEVLSPNGIILWKDTFLNRNKSSAQTVCLVPNRKFDTSENIFLALCIMQLSEKAQYLQRQNLEIKLDSYEINVLSKILNGTEKMLKYFPYSDALSVAKQDNSKDGLNKSLSKYEREIRDRFSKELITNRFYMNLIIWYKEFQKEIRLVHALKEGDRNFLYESTRSIDTAYEFFIFFNLMDHMSRLDKCQVYNIVWETDHYFDFNYNKKSFRFIHNYEIKQGDTKMQLRPLTPDFFVEKIEEGSEKNKGVLVGDSKNYTNLKGDAKNMEHLIENYMNQTKVSSGLIIARDEKHTRNPESDQYSWSFEYLDPLLYQKIEEFEGALSRISDKIFKACDR